MGLAPLAPSLHLGLAMLAFGIVLLLASACYQWAGFAKKGDTVMLDWRDYLLGWAPVCGLCLATSAAILLARL